MTDSARDLLVHGIASAKAGEKQTAQRYLERVLNFNPTPQQTLEALYWMSEISSDPDEKRHLLETILLNAPNDARARRKFALLTGQLKEEEIVDPDRLAQPTANTTDVEDPRRFTCPQCGGRMTFMPDGQSLTCEYCTSQQSLKPSREGQSQVSERDFVLALATARGHLRPVNTRTFHCEGCGVEFQLPALQMTMTCPYCLSSYVVQNKDEHQTYLPDALLPFEVDRQDVKVRFAAWIKENLEEPPDSVDEWLGLYLPVWSFEVGGSLIYRGEMYKNRQWMPFNQEKPLMERHVLVPAVKNPPRNFTHALLQYDLSRMVPYDERYLANIPAEIYQVPLADASLEARALVYERLRGQSGDVAAMALRNLSISTAGMLVEAFSLVHFPVWVSHYSLNDRRYAATINGQNGHVDGELPAPSIRSFIKQLFDPD